MEMLKPSAALVLTGAGLGEANGLYLPMGRVRFGAPVFENDQRCMLSREPHNDRDSGQSRFGWVLGRDRRPLYGAPCEVLEPPPAGWLKFDGALPLPRLQSFASKARAAAVAMLTFKECGNASFKAERYVEADATWTRGLGLLDSLVESEEELIVALHSNRAEARLRRRRWAEALGDAHAVLLRRPTHDKALLRAAAAAVELGRYMEAQAFAQGCLDEHPRNSDAKRLCLKVEQLIEKERRRLYNQATAGTAVLLADDFEQEGHEGRTMRAFAARDANSKKGFAAFSGYGSARDGSVPPPPLSLLPHHRANLPPEQVEAADRYLQQLREKEQERKQKAKEALDEYPRVKKEYRLQSQEDMAMGRAAAPHLQEAFPSQQKKRLGPIVGARDDAELVCEALTWRRQLTAGVALAVLAGLPRLSSAEEGEMERLFAGLEGRPPPLSARPPREDARCERLRTAKAAIRWSLKAIEA